MVITLFILSLFVLLNIGVDETVQYVTEKTDLSIYLEEEITEEDYSPLKEELERTEGVASVYYKSKEDAWEEFKSLGRKYEEISSELGDEDNPLPASLEVKLNDINKVYEITEIAKKDAYTEIVEKVNVEEREKTFNNLIGITNFIKNFGLLLTIIFVTISFLIIFNTIRITIFSRREEVEIMKLVGATNWYVRSPFLLEGVLYGIIGAIFSFVLIVSGYYSFANLISKWSIVPDSAHFQYFENNLFLVFAAQAVLGMIIGIISSYIAIRKHLRRVN